MKKIVVLLMALMFGLGFASLSISGVAVSKSSFRPGDTGTITFAVTNVNYTSIANSVSVQVSGPASFTYDSSVALGDMGPGTTSMVSIPIRVPDSAPSGLYVFDVKVYGSLSTQSVGSTNFMAASSITVQVLDAPILSIAGYPGTYSEGNNLTFSIDNHGGAAKQLRLSVLAPFAINGANQIYVGDVGTSKNVTLDLNVAGVGEGSNTLVMALDYYDELGNEVLGSKNISLNVKKQRTDLSFKQVSDIVSGKESAARFMVTNTGRALKDVKIAFLNGNLTVTGGNEVQLGDLDAGQSKELVFTVTPQLPPGTQNTEAQITYVQDGKDQMKDTQVTFDISSDSDVRVFVDSKPTPMAAGQEETLSVTVANTWDYPIESTVVGIDGGFYDLLSVQDEQYIGLLNKDDFSSVQFKIGVKAGEVGDKNLTVRVRYKEPGGAIVERDKTITVNVSAPAASGNGLGGFEVIVGVVALAAIVWWFFIRKKKASA